MSDADPLALADALKRIAVTSQEAEMEDAALPWLFHADRQVLRSAAAELRRLVSECAELRQQNERLTELINLIAPPMTAEEFKAKYLDGETEATE